MGVIPGVPLPNAERRGLTILDLTHVVLSQGHQDHTGGLVHLHDVSQKRRSKEDFTPSRISLRIPKPFPATETATSGYRIDPVPGPCRNTFSPEDFQRTCLDNE